MKCLRVYSTADGESHFDEVEIPTTSRQVARAQRFTQPGPIADMGAPRGYSTRQPKTHSREMKVLYGILSLLRV